MNRRIGRVGAALSAGSTLAFAVSMIAGLFRPTLFYSCFASIFIALGFIPFMVSLFSLNRDGERKAAGYAGLAFAAVYAAIILLVYYAECTTVRLNPALSQEALSIISFGRLGSLFFNYDLLGYACMALAAFFFGFTVEPRDRGDRILQWLLWLKAVFFLPCLLVPLFPVFTPGGGGASGTILLEFWCAYYLPVCLLGFRYFNRGLPQKGVIRRYAKAEK